MLAFYLGIYTIFIVLLWGLFIVAKIHAYKFKAFSERIPKVTETLLFFLIFLSIIGYILIFYSISGTTNVVNNFDLNGIDY